MRLLIHACCGPCLLTPARLLAAEGHDLLIYWYNPNVQPYREYRRRLGAFRDVVARERLRAEVADRYDIDFFLKEVAREREGRCPRCYAERLGRAAAFAVEKGCDAFTTTLLGSRHQNHEAIIAAGEDAARAAGVAFYYRDFRPHDRESHLLAREMGLYLQGYCGCLYSEEERYRRARAPTDDVRP